MSQLDDITTVALRAITSAVVAACDSYEEYKSHDESVFDYYSSRIADHLVAIYCLLPYEWTHAPENVYNLFRATPLVLDYARGTGNVTWSTFRQDVQILLLKGITHDERICTHNVVEKLLAEGDIIERYLREGRTRPSPVVLALHAITREQ